MKLSSLEKIYYIIIIWNKLLMLVNVVNTTVVRYFKHIFQTTLTVLFLYDIFYQVPSAQAVSLSLTLI